MSEQFNAVMRELMTAENTTEQPDQEEWAAMIERINTKGAIHEITEDTYWYFLEVLPPHWMDRQSFAFAEGEEPLQLFWENRDNYRTRSLTWEETSRLCEARRHTLRQNS